MSDAGPVDGGITRLSFIKTSAGVAAGVGATAIGVPAVAGAVEGGVQTDPSGPNPSEPVFAYVRDAARGEVTVIRGTNETTYRDRKLVKRILAAAPPESRHNGGGE